MMREYFEKLAAESEIQLSEYQYEQFQIFYYYFFEVNQYMNLTAITDEQEIVQKHFIDSLSLSKYANLDGKKIIDIGTGAGFPGIPLAIFYPDAEFVLLDSLQKRVHFINQVCEKCSLRNIKTVHGRAEEFGKNIEYREQFDYCVSRAVAKLPMLLELCIPYCKVEGVFVSYKSELLEQELKDAKNAMRILHCKLKKKEEYKIADTDYYRVYAFFQKTDITNKKYPRQYGKIKSNPL